jgi:glutamate synthase (NADPH/NADH) small chain
MGKPTGFITTPRLSPVRRPVQLRLRDWHEVYEVQSPETTIEQASRCMDCGIPFCHHACPLGNLIPEWNDLVFHDDFRDAIERLHVTNNFPEFTGRLCPAPCESACVVAIADDAVTIERIEYEIIERAFSEGWVNAQAPVIERDESVCIVGSGPAGLAAAQQLRRAGYRVTVIERQEEIGGLLRFGIPEFKMEKAIIDRRLGQLVAEGIEFRVGIAVGVDVTLDQLRSDYDAVVLAIGSTRPRDITVPGRELAGIFAAMEYLKPANLSLTGVELPDKFNAANRDVVILGGGDTGADCLGTALRQNARSVTQLEIMNRPPDERPESQPWPTMALLYKVTSAHEEGGERHYAAETVAFVGNELGAVRALQVRRREGETVEMTEIAADMVLIAAGFIGPELEELARDGSLGISERGTIDVAPNWQCASAVQTAAPVFACGDAVRGQSLIVWAIAEGRSAAASVDRYFNNGFTLLDAPLEPHTSPWDA